MKVQDNKENFANCICVNCPTHNDCMKEGEQRLFCSRGKSSCELERAGCLCGECPVASENDLEGLYYCEQGTES